MNHKHTIAACCIGYVTQAIVNNLAPLLFIIFNESYGVPLGQITMLITVNFCVQLTVDFLAAKWADKIGYRRCMILAHLFATCGLVGMAVLPQILESTFTGLLISAVIYAMGGGILEVLVSPIVEACPTKNKSGIMSFLHSFYCWGAVAIMLLSTLFFALFGKENWQYLALAWAIVPFLNIFYFLRVPIFPLTEEGKGMKMKELFSTRLFWILALLMLCAGASELAMSQWASAFAERALGVSKAVGDLAGPCLFALLMGTSRVLYAKISEKVDINKYIILNSAICIFSYILASFSGNAALSLAGCALCGFAVGIMWPGVFNIAAAKCANGGTTLFALLALAGDLGCSSGPTLVGLMSGVFDENLKTGLAFAMVFPVLLIFGMLICKRITDKK